MLHLKIDHGTKLMPWPSTARDATDTQPLSEKCLRYATSKPRRAVVEKFLAGLVNVDEEIEKGLLHAR
jgi:hypothetical protein